METNQSLSTEKLPFYRKVLFGVGDSSFSLLFTVTMLFYLYFLTDVAGLKPVLAGTILLAGKAWDAITDPTVGFLSDRTKTRWGRRRPYILFGAIPLAVTYLLIWQTYPFAAGNQGLLFATYTILSLLFWTCFTVTGIPYAALMPELTLDYDDRTTLVSARMFFSIIFGLVAAVVPMIIVGAYPSLSKGYSMMGISIGLFAIIPLVICFFGTKERPEFQEMASLSLWKSLKETVKNRPFVFAMIIFLLSWACVDVLSATFLYYITYVLGLTVDDVPILMGTLFVTATLFLPFWVFISNKLGKKPAYIFGMAFWALVMSLLFFMKPGIPLSVLVALCFLAGIGISTAHLIPWAMIIDCIDYDELKTGARREGMYTGFTLFLQKLASSLSLFLVGIFLQWSGYVANMIQTDRAIFAIKFLIGPVTAIMLILSIVVSFFYPITREEHNKLRAELDKREKTATS
ncbi:MAG: MFS transporter [Deltaproteobacteria bacterium]|nr:MFS transporter [Candidatus Zymogenaceae bacterium]